MVAGRLDAALREAGIPIMGVAIGNDADRSTWRVDYADDATDADKRAGAVLVASFDPQAPTVITSYTTKLATDEADRPIMRAMVLYFLRVFLQREPTEQELATHRGLFVQAFLDVSASVDAERRIDA